MAEQHEIWDIYDVNKKPTGRTMVRDVFNMKPGEYHLSVLGIVKRTDGRFLITKRDMNKRWAPGHWETSGGACVAGEDSYHAVLREVKEESGIDVTGCPYKLSLTYRRDNPDEGDNYFVDVYLFVKDFKEDEIKLQVEETCDYKIATLEEIKAIGEEGKFLHYNSIKSVFEDTV